MGSEKKVNGRRREPKGGGMEGMVRRFHCSAANGEGMVGERRLDIFQTIKFVHMYDITITLTINNYKARNINN